MRSVVCDCCRESFPTSLVKSFCSRVGGPIIYVCRNCSKNKVKTITCETMPPPAPASSIDSTNDNNDNEDRTKIGTLWGFK